MYIIYYKTKKNLIKKNHLTSNSLELKKQKHNSIFNLNHLNRNIFGKPKTNIYIGYFVFIHETHTHIVLLLICMHAVYYLYLCANGIYFKPAIHVCIFLKKHIYVQFSLS